MPGERKEVKAAVEDTCARLADTKTITHPGVVALLPQVASGKVRAGFFGTLTEEQRGMLQTFIAEGKQHMGRRAGGPEAKMLPTLVVFENLFQAKSMNMTLDAQLHLKGVVDCQDEAGAKELAASLEPADTGLRELFSVEAPKEQHMPASFKKMFAAVDWSKPMISGKSDKTKLSFDLDDKLPRLWCGGMASSIIMMWEFRRKMEARQLQGDNGPMMLE